MHHYVPSSSYIWLETCARRACRPVSILVLLHASLHCIRLHTLVAYGFMMSYQGWQVIGAGVTGPETSPAKRGWSGPNARGDARQARFNSCRASLRLTDTIRRRYVEAIAQLCLRDQPSSSILVHRHARSASEQTLPNK